MNIFAIEADDSGNPDPVASAKSQCDDHIQKMYIESAQMLSTAHRLLDGRLTYVERTDKKGNLVYDKMGNVKMKKHWELSSPTLESVLYKVVHPKHPSTLWTMESQHNYNWHVKHLEALLNEFAKRHHKMPKTHELLWYLKQPPANIPKTEKATPIKLAMNQFPHCVVLVDGVVDVVQSYRNFYIEDKARFATWEKGSPAPEWWTEHFNRKNNYGVN